MRLNNLLDKVAVVKLQRDLPGNYALWSSIRRMHVMGRAERVPESKYAKRGRNKLMFENYISRALAFVKTMRHNCFCVCRCIARDSRLSASMRTIN